MKLQQLIKCLVHLHEYSIAVTSDCDPIILYGGCKCGVGMPGYQQESHTVNVYLGNSHRQFSSACGYCHRKLLDGHRL